MQDLDNLLNDLATTSSENQMESPRCYDLENEIRNFDKISRVRLDTKILQFWNNKKIEFPLLSSIALDIISAPVTEVSVEQMFSHLNFIMGKFRTTLKADLLEDIMFLRLNHKFNN